MSISMHLQNFVKFYKTVLKILSGNQIMTDGRKQPKSNITSTFSKRGYKYGKYPQIQLALYPHIPKLIQVSHIPLYIYKNILYP